MSTKEGAAGKRRSGKRAIERRAGEGSRSGGTRRRSIAKPGASSRPASVAPEQRHRVIAVAAYFRAERRGFAPGGELDDWLAAELEVDALLRGGDPSEEIH